MRLSRYPINTTKETPAEAEIVSHQLMLRAGLIRRTAAGIYSWLPLGLRTLRKVEAIVREEMDRAGALELLMPAVQPGELWQESGRWSEYGPELLRFQRSARARLRDRSDARGADHRHRAARAQELSTAAVETSRDVHGLARAQQHGVLPDQVGLRLAIARQDEEHGPWTWNG